VTKSRGMMREAGRRRLARGAGVTVGATLLMGGVAQADTFTVNSLADPSDPGNTTLHDALTQAHMSPQPSDRIVFASGLTGSINLTTNLPNIDYALEIDGPGASQLAISGQNVRGIFHSVGLAPPGLQISGLTLRNGNNVADTRGGAIFLAGGSPAKVSDAVLSGNTAQKGGAIYSLNGSLDIARSTFTANTSTAAGTGGAIQSYGTALSISDSVVSGNHGDQGGGIQATADGPFGSLLLQRSTVSGNSATGCCGGIFAIETPTSTIRSSTISGNTVTSGPSGGMYIEGPLDIAGSTISGNSSSEGGGIYAYQSVEPTIRDTIVAGNSAPSGPDVWNGVSAAFSLIGNTSGATIGGATPSSNLTGLDPQLQPLAANGGPTPTMALAATSPAIDKGSAFGLATDQRGSPRPFDVPSIPNSAAPGADGSDMGAFEFQQAPAKKKCKKKHKKHGKHKRSAENAKKKHKKHGCKKKRKKKRSAGG
jgi:predicted outer membrane repeat protein